MNSGVSENPGTPRINRFAVAGLLLLMLVIAVLGLRPAGADTRLAQSLQTTGHFVFFGGLAFLAAAAVPHLLPWTRDRLWLQYAFGLVVSIGLGFGLEVAQKFIPNRLASWEDVIYDAIGAVSFIVLLMVIHSRSRTGWSWRWLRWIGSAVFLGTMIYGAAPFVTCVVDHWGRYRAMPTVLSFSDRWSRRFVGIEQTVTLCSTEPPIGWPPDQLNVALCRIRPGDPYPGLAMHEPYPDWSNFKTFAFDLMPKTSMPDTLHIRIQDLDHNQDYYDRFNRRFSIQPEFQTIRIPIDEIRKGPRHRELDTTRMWSFKIFIIRPTTDVEFYVGNFRLE